jgi:predicted alpha/beta superfamily hydrolase
MHPSKVLRHRWNQWIQVGLLVNAIFFAPAAFASQHFSVIVNIPPNTPPSSSIYLTGDSDALCSWQPQCVVMNKIQDSTYQAEVELPDGMSRVSYKITRGSWDTEAADGAGNALANAELSLTSPSTQSILSVANWKDLGALGVTGDLKIISSFASPQLGNSRNLEVWLPPGYEDQKSQSYPVIYMHDGQNVFNPLTSNTGVAWGMDSTMTKLIEEGEIPPAIVVAVDCIADQRLEEYNYSSRGALYADFLVHTVKPFIDANYRTLPDRSHTFTMGSSMGAAITVALLWHYPDVFSEGAGLSLPVSYPGYDIYSTVSSPKLPNLPVKLYLDDGTVGLDATFAQPDASFQQYLLSLGWNASNFTYQVFPYASHSEVDWARRLAIPTQWLLTDERAIHSNAMGARAP